MLLLLPDIWPPVPAAVPGASPQGPDPCAASLATLEQVLKREPASRRQPSFDRLGVPLANQGDSSQAEAWRRLAGQLGQSQLLMLAIAEELRPLLASLRSLNLIDASSNAPAIDRSRRRSRPRRPPGPVQGGQVMASLEFNSQLPELPAPAPLPPSAAAPSPESPRPESPRPELPRLGSPRPGSPRPPAPC